MVERSAKCGDGQSAKSFDSHFWQWWKTKLIRMQHKRNIARTRPVRLTHHDVVKVDEFRPWWIRCSKCSRLAYLTPRWEKMKGECKCGVCGGMYSLPFSPEYERRFSSLPLWLKADFRGNVFWALNGEHLQLLDRVIRSTLRERPVMLGRRLSFTMRMPFNLPKWILSAKNRPGLLKLIGRLRSTIPQEMRLVDAE